MLNYEPSHEPVEIRFSAFIDSELDRSERSTSYPGNFVPGEKSLVLNE
jgi:hypothetical protein